MSTAGAFGVRHVLVVDNEAHAVAPFAQRLAAAGYEVDTSTDANEAIAELSRQHFHAVLVDLGRQDGYRVLDHARSLVDPPACLVMAASANIDTVVTAMRRGASDFLEKPVDSDELIARLENALEIAARRRKLEAFEAREQSVAPPFSYSSGMREALLLADKVAATPSSPALIVGESGVGKEVIATRIHNTSRRRAGPFVRVNLAAISESVLEAELFGSVKGAFTDSKSNRAGYFASAGGGTILLDEIGEFRMANQAKLLRVLEERKFFAVGSDRERAIDVRVVAATNRDPQGMLDGGLLRPDLFYRLGTVIRIPPLRSRVDEIVPLATHFVSMYCSEFGRPQCSLTAAAVRRLEEYPWPGNVRQLRNTIERAIMLTEGDEITDDALDLPPVQAPPPPSSSRDASVPPPRRTTAPHRLHDVRERALAHVERGQIVRALESANGSRSRAAMLLGLSRSTLYEKLKRYNLR